MDTNIPILNPEQIQDLNFMIQNILQQNSKSIDVVLSELVEVQSTSIMKLYNLTVGEWIKKQKIIQNLCHFSINMMSTVQYLWGHKNENQERLSNAEVVIDTLNKHIQQLGEENQVIKHKYHQAQSHIESISGQKEKIEELYRTQSCCALVNSNLFPEVKIKCDQIGINNQNQNSFLQQNSQIMEQFNKTLQIKQFEIISLKDEKKSLEKKLQQLMQEHQLVKMQVELAQIAVKDALSYRDSSMMMSNRSDPNVSYRDEIYTTKSHAQFLNGDLECFSNLEDSFNFEQRQSIPKQISASQDNFKVNSSLIGNSNSECSSNKNQLQDNTAVSNPFKKKISKIDKGNERCFTQYIISQQQNDIKQNKMKIQSLLVKANKTVSLQCNLIENIPKLQFFEKKQPKVQIKKTKNQAKLQQLFEKRQRNMKNMKNQSKKVNIKPISKSQIIKKSNIQPEKKTIQIQKQQNEQNSVGSLSRLYNFFSTKIISSRIRVK